VCDSSAHSAQNSSGRTNAELFAEATTKSDAAPIVALVKAEAAFIEQQRAAAAKLEAEETSR